MAAPHSLHLDFKQLRLDTTGCALTTEPVPPNRNVPIRERLTSHRRSGRGDYSDRFANVAIANASLDTSRLALRVEWQDHSTDEYPLIWLRDNCQCEQCFSQSALSRYTHITHIDPNIAPLELQLHDGVVTLQWPDHHESTFKADWLKQRSFNVNAIQQRVERLENRTVMWGSEMQDQIPAYDYNDVLAHDIQFYRCLSDLNEVGLVLIQNAPQQEGILKKFCDIVAYPLVTHYGETFSVRNKIQPNNLAYTGAHLGVHADLPYYERLPEFQLLHCIKQFEQQGGENQFVDGVKVAWDLKAADPVAFDLLTSCPVEYFNFGVDHIDFFKVLSCPLIGLNRDNHIVSVRYNNQVRDTVLNLPFDYVRPFYAALHKLGNLFYAPENVITHKLAPGEIVMFANDRVLHGRSAYDVATGERLLEGAYIARDELRSRLRLLARKLNFY